MIQKNFLYIIGNIISQPFKDLWPRTIRQAIYFIDFYKIIMRNFGMAIVIAISSKCQKLCIRNTNILHTIDYISASPTDTDAQYLYIFCIISHIIVASINIDCKIKQKFDKLYQKALLFLFARLANDFIPYSSSSSSYTLSPINMMNNRKNETAENNNAIKSTTAKEEKGSIFVIKLTAKRNGATA